MNNLLRRALDKQKQIKVRTSAYKKSNKSKKFWLNFQIIRVFFIFDHWLFRFN